MSDNETKQPGEEDLAKAESAAADSDQKASLYGNVSRVMGISAPGEGRSTPKISAEEIEKLRQRQVEPDNLPLGILFGIVAVLTVVVFALSMGVTEAFKMESQRQVYVKRLSVENPQLIQTQERGQAELKRIKIEEMMAKVAKDPSLLAPFGPQAKPAAVTAAADSTETVAVAESSAAESDTASHVTDTSDSSTESRHAQTSSDTEDAGDGAA